MSLAQRWYTLLAVGAALAAIAMASPLPRFWTDKDVYVALSDRYVLPGCDDFHCFRVLVPWVLSLVPGSTDYLTWRVYAVICQTLAAGAMYRWVRRCGAGPQAASQVMWLTALGSGSLYTLFDPFTSDPLMHLLAPVLMIMVAHGRAGSATTASAFGVFAKEFAAVPLVIFAGWRALQRRWSEALVLVVATAAVVAVWLAWQLTARSLWGYSTGPTRSADLLHGGFLLFWVQNIGPQLVVVATAGALGALWLLWPAGAWWAPPDVRRLTVAALPALLLWNYVQQPDRALWNFAFVIMPAVAVVLERVPAWAGWTLIGVQALVNLRIGAQLEWVPPVRVTLPLVMVMASVLLVWAARWPRLAPQEASR